MADKRRLNPRLSTLTQIDIGMGAIVGRPPVVENAAIFSPRILWFYARDLRPVERHTELIFQSQFGRLRLPPREASAEGRERGEKGTPVHGWAYSTPESRVWLIGRPLNS